MNKTDRMVQTLAENHKDKKMTRKVDTYEYEDPQHVLLEATRNRK